MNQIKELIHIMTEESWVDLVSDLCAEKHMRVTYWNSIVKELREEITSGTLYS